MKDMEQIIAAKDAFLAALDAMPDNVVGMCTLTVTDRNEDVITASNATDTVAATRCLSGLVESIRSDLDLSEEQAVPMLAVAAANMLADLYPELLGDTGKIGVHTAIALFASAITQFPGATGMCGGKAQNSEGYSVFVDTMSKEQAGDLCAGFLFGMMDQGIVSSKELITFLGDVWQCALQLVEERGLQGSGKRRRRGRGAPSEPDGSNEW